MEIYMKRKVDGPVCAGPCGGEAPDPRAPNLRITVISNLNDVLTEVSRYWDISEFPALDKTISRKKFKTKTCFWYN